MIVGIVIPAYNEEDRISSVLSNVLCFTVPDRVYVVDDGSADRTAEIAAGYKGVNLIRHDTNRGKGEALKTGFRSAIQDKVEGIITLDSDGQHDPACIPEFIATMERTGCDMVLGVRQFRIGEMPLDRIFSNLISSVTVSLVAGQRIPDSQCGYRMFRADRLKQVSIISQRFEIETELAIRAVRRNWKITFYPIPVKYGESRSYIHRISDTQRFCRLIIRLMTESKHG